MKEIVREVKASLRSMSNKRLNAIEAWETSPDDLLGMVLDSNSNEIKHDNKNSGKTSRSKVYLSLTCLDNDFIDSLSGLAKSR